MSYLVFKTKLLIKRYDCLIKLEYNFIYSFQTSFHIFASRCVAIFVMVVGNELELGTQANQ